VGVALYAGSGPCRNGEDLITAADQAMYQSKHAGKNRVTVAEPPAAAVPATARR
jgi:PleD family two-component response regulator